MQFIDAGSLTGGPASLLRRSVKDGQCDVEASGAWTVANVSALATLVDDMRGTEQFSRLHIDAGAIEHIDTFGACMLERLVREGTARGQTVTQVGLPKPFQDLFDEVDKADGTPPGPPEKPSRTAFLEAIGRALADGGRDLVRFLDMLGAIGAALGRVVLRPRSFRLTSTVQQLDRVGFQAIPIVILITVLIGAIIAQQGIFHFRKFGAESYVVDLVGILVLREIGVLLVSIVVAGRSGSSYAAELGAMKMREEIDALRTMGLDPVEVLVLPRVAALVLGLPALTFIGSLAALAGGGAVAWAYGGMSPAIYLARLRDAISVTHFEVGMIKAPFMALVIGVVACSEGFQVKGSAESLGLRTTSSVVQSIFLVIVLDGCFAVFFASIGM